jgi:hypothetical protein
MRKCMFVQTRSFSEWPHPIQVTKACDLRRDKNLKQLQFKSSHFILIYLQYSLHEEIQKFLPAPVRSVCFACNKVVSFSAKEDVLSYSTIYHQHLSPSPNSQVEYIMQKRAIQSRYAANTKALMQKHSNQPTPEKCWSSDANT